MLAKVEFAVGDNGVGPGLGFLVGGHKGAFEFVGGGGGFDEGDVAALVAVDKVSVDGGDGCRAVAGTFDRSPFDLAGFEFNADGITAVVLVAAVDVAVDEDHAAVVVLEDFGFEEVDLFGGLAIELQ